MTPTRRRPDAADPDEKLTSTQFAKMLVVSRNTFWSYLTLARQSRQAGGHRMAWVPEPDGVEPFSGKPYWFRSTVVAAIAARPGPGKRTDLPLKP